MPVTIMVVDDDADGRFFTERLLRKTFQECALLACGSVDEAVRRLHEAPLDAIVTDYQLGRQSGCEFIRQARRAGLTCPIVMVTCSADPNVAREAKQGGATAVFETGEVDFAAFLKTELANPRRPSAEPRGT